MQYLYEGEMEVVANRGSMFGGNLYIVYIGCTPAINVPNCYQKTK